VERQSPNVEVRTAIRIDGIGIDEVACPATHEANPGAVKEIALRPGSARRAVDVSAATPGRLDGLGCEKLQTAWDHFRAGPVAPAVEFVFDAAAR
jgi:hypothetical protein